ncbi:hypothetical protein L1987_00105 [Smallanthus sonchifolius]|uniref:Uncharacterized protein n=1 Tax=Smallanthus sonchifolius TaxID=185202 RepID=A0ACB9K1A3_9ASTR|nr:hypothetical protein L1987_00105 [Smallanthus sonchifolius]
MTDNIPKDVKVYEKLEQILELGMKEDGKVERILELVQRDRMQNVEDRHTLQRRGIPFSEPMTDNIPKDVKVYEKLEQILELGMKEDGKVERILELVQRDRMQNVEDRHTLQRRGIPFSEPMTDNIPKDVKVYEKLEQILELGMKEDGKVERILELVQRDRMQNVEDRHTLQRRGIPFSEPMTDNIPKDVKVYEKLEQILELGMKEDGKVERILELVQRDRMQNVEDRHTLQRRGIPFSEPMTDNIPKDVKVYEKLEQILELGMKEDGKVERILELVQRDRMQNVEDRHTLQRRGIPFSEPMTDNIPKDVKVYEKLEQILELGMKEDGKVERILELVQRDRMQNVEDRHTLQRRGIPFSEPMTDNIPKDVKVYEKLEQILELGMKEDGKVERILELVQRDRMQNVEDRHTLQRRGIPFSEPMTDNIPKDVKVYEKLEQILELGMKEDGKVERILELVQRDRMQNVEDRHTLQRRGIPFSEPMTDNIPKDVKVYEKLEQILELGMKEDGKVERILELVQRDRMQNVEDRHTLQRRGIPFSEPMTDNIPKDVKVYEKLEQILELGMKEDGKVERILELVQRDRMQNVEDRHTLQRRGIPFSEPMTDNIPKDVKVYEKLEQILELGMKEDGKVERILELVQRDRMPTYRLVALKPNEEEKNLEWWVSSLEYLTK